MEALTILAIQSKGVAVIVIICLLLGAAIIGYLAAWFYSKSIYVKKINILQAEKEELNKQIADLTSDNEDLKKSLVEKDNEIEKLTKKSKG